MQWYWILIAVLSDVSVYLCQAWRWNLLLKPIVQVPFWRSVSAIYVGLFANEALPLRSGEAIRVYLQSLWSRIPFTTSVSSVIIERLIDGIWLMLGFGLAMLYVELPPNLVLGASILGSIVFLLATLMGFAVLFQRMTRRALGRVRWASKLFLLLDGLNVMGRSRSFYYALGASVVYLLLQVIPLYAMIRGYGLDLPIQAAAVLLVVLRFGTIIPGPPGNVGLFNAFAVLGLRLVGVDRQTAIGLSGVMFFVITVPLLLAGTIALAATGLKLAEIKRHASSHMRSAEAPLAPTSPGTA